MSEIRYQSAEAFWNQPVHVLRHAMPIEGIDRGRFVRQVLLDPNFDPEGSILAVQPGEIRNLGYILAIAPPAPEGRPKAGFITLFGVKPEYRRQGVGSGLLERAEAFLASRGCAQITFSAYPQGYFVPGVDVNAYAEGYEFLLKRGYREIIRPLAMECSLWNYETPSWVTDISNALKPEGGVQVRIEKGSTIDSRLPDLLRFARDQFSPDWERMVREAMLDILNGDRQERLLVATEIDQDKLRVVGFSHFKAERFGPIGVHPDYRGRGIGHVLLHASLRAQQEAGYRSSWFLWSDDRTANRIYTPAGFREVRRFALLRKEI